MNFETLLGCVEQWASEALEVGSPIIDANEALAVQDIVSLARVGRALSPVQWQELARWIAMIPEAAFPILSKVAAQRTAFEIDAIDAERIEYVDALASLEDEHR